MYVDLKASRKDAGNMYKYIRYIKLTVQLCLAEGMDRISQRLETLTTLGTYFLFETQLKYLVIVPMLIG